MAAGRKIKLNARAEKVNKRNILISIILLAWSARTAAVLKEPNENMVCTGFVAQIIEMNGR